MLLHLPDGTNPSRSVTPLPPRSRPCLPRAMRRCRADSLRLSLTWDQGPEMHEWEYVSVDADIDIYFCDPHSPWQLTLATRHQRKHCECWKCRVRADRTGWVPAVRGDSREYWPPSGVPFV